MIALRFESRQWSWPEVDAEVARVAEGLAPGSRVVITSFNHPDMLFAFLASMKAGATFVPINARLTASERAWLTRSVPAATSSAAAALFTSGTTGQPKLIELTHENFIANAKATEETLGRPKGWLCTLPLFHIGGLAMAYRWSLARCLLVLEPSFDAARASWLLESGEVSHASFVPTTLGRVLEANAGRGFSSEVKAVLIGGGPMSPELLARARRVGLPVLQTYGLTEATSQVTTETLAEADGTTAGVAIPGLEVRIVEGEVQVRGPSVTGEAGRWLATGDLGTLDEKKRLIIFSRRVDLIITGGENVYPAEVENVLGRHPAVHEVVVVPRADETWGQVPVAFVVWKGEPAPLLEWAREHLAAFKLPRELFAIDAVPRNANGKVERRALQAQLHAKTRVV